MKNQSCYFRTNKGILKLEPVRIINFYLFLDWSISNDMFVITEEIDGIYKIENEYKINPKSGMEVLLGKKRLKMGDLLVLDIKSSFHSLKEGFKQLIKHIYDTQNLIITDNIGSTHYLLIFNKKENHMITDNEKKLFEKFVSPVLDFYDNIRITVAIINDATFFGRNLFSTTSPFIEIRRMKEEIREEIREVKEEIREFKKEVRGELKKIINYFKNDFNKETEESSEFIKKKRPR